MVLIIKAVGCIESAGEVGIFHITGAGLHPSAASLFVAVHGGVIRGGLYAISVAINRSGLDSGGLHSLGRCFGAPIAPGGVGVLFVRIAAGRAGVERVAKGQAVAFYLFCNIVMSGCLCVIIDLGYAADGAGKGGVALFRTGGRGDCAFVITMAGSIDIIVDLGRATDGAGKGGVALFRAGGLGDGACVIGMAGRVNIVVHILFPTAGASVGSIAPLRAGRRCDDACAIAMYVDRIQIPPLRIPPVWRPALNVSAVLHNAAADIQRQTVALGNQHIGAVIGND